MYNLDYKNTVYDHFYFLLFTTTVLPSRFCSSAFDERWYVSFRMEGRTYKGNKSYKIKTNINYKTIILFFLLLCACQQNYFAYNECSSCPVCARLFV